MSAAPNIPVAVRWSYSECVHPHWIYDDGGRKAAGYKNEARDCVVRAIAIVTGLPYKQVYDDIKLLARMEPAGNGLWQRRRSSPRNGVQSATTKLYLQALGWQWCPTMFVGSGCRVHLKADELPEGRLVVSVSRHLVAMIDGVIHDTFDPSRNGTRCVYGYWQKESNGQGN